MPGIPPINISNQIVSKSIPQNLPQIITIPPVISSLAGMPLFVIVPPNITDISFSGNPLELKTTKLSDKKEFDEIYKLDDEEFGSLIHYDDADEFQEYLEWKNINTLLVKDKDKKLIGYYQIYMASKGNLYLETLNLKPEYRGKHTGFTEHVFKEILEIAKKKHAKKISLHVSTGNKIAIDLYKRWGFKIVRTEKDFYFSETESNDAYYMEKGL